MIHFTADLHLGHKKMYGRPQFKSVTEHDDFIISRWNEVVAEHDHVYIAGDFIWPGVKDPFQYIERMNGEKILVPGDHDHRDIERWQLGMIGGRPFQCARDIYDLRYMEWDQSIIISHWPQQHWRRSHYGSWHVYGHLHHADAGPWGKRIQVGIDRFNYYPVSFTDLKEVMSLLPDNPNLLKGKDGKDNPETVAGPDSGKVPGPNESVPG